MVRGDVHEIKLPRGRGHVQHGTRYAVIVQADDLLALATVVVCPTSRSAPRASFHPVVAVGNDQTIVMCEMVVALRMSGFAFLLQPARSMSCAL